MIYMLWPKNICAILQVFDIVNFDGRTKILKYSHYKTKIPI